MRRSVSADGHIFGSQGSCCRMARVVSRSGNWQLATGQVGTVYLCHLFLVHSAQPHRGSEPRFLAQPPPLPEGEFDPSLLASPVQIAIRKAIAMKP
jgi:hypothetical protein